MSFFKKFFLLPAFLCLHFLATAQYKVHFVIEHLPTYHHTGDPIYIAGSFNGWNPRDEKMKLETINNKPGITIELRKGMFEYKFTKGSWEQVESAEGGFPTQNRRIDVEGDTTIQVDIQHWAD